MHEVNKFNNILKKRKKIEVSLIFKLNSFLSSCINL